MNLFRILLFLVAAYVVWRLYRALTAKSGGNTPPSQPREDYEAMARCSKCGVFAPASTLSQSGRCGRCSE